MSRQIEELKAELMAKELELAKVLGERDALSALVSEWRRGVYLVDGWNQAQSERNIGDEDEWLRHLGEWASQHAGDRRPDVSLTARDARMKAEALESLRATPYSLYLDQLLRHIDFMALQYRKQAEESAQ